MLYIYGPHALSVANKLVKTGKYRIKENTTHYTTLLSESAENYCTRYSIVLVPNEDDKC